MPAQRKFVLLLLFWITIAVSLTAYLFIYVNSTDQARFEDLQLRHKMQRLLNHVQQARVSMSHTANWSGQLPDLKKSLKCDVLVWRKGQPLQSTLPPLVQNQLALLLLSNPASSNQFSLQLPEAGYHFLFSRTPRQKLYFGIGVNVDDLPRVGQTNWLFLSLLLVVLLFLGGASMYFSGRPFFHALNRMRESLLQSDNGRLQTVDETKIRDEAAELVFRFNQYAQNLNALLDIRHNREEELTAQLKESRSNLIKLTENLERVVERRTKELREKDLQLLQTGKLAGLGQLSTGIAHEINQPLNVIKLTVTGMMRQYSLKKELNTEMVVRELNNINQQTIRVQKIIHHMKAFARKRANIHFEAVELNAPLKDALLMVGQQLNEHSIQLDLQLADDLPPISGDAIQVEQIFINLLNNARDALETKEGVLKQKGREEFEKKITVRTWHESGDVFLKVSDNGSGMTENIRKQIFEPFFSTKQQKGTGLGMSITFNLVKNMNGEIKVESELAKGTSFTIRFEALKK